MESHLHPLLFVLAVAAVAPLLGEALAKWRIPGVVLEILGGILIGPEVLGLVQAEGAVKVLSGLGLSFLFLMAGMEIDFARLRGRPLKLAVCAWCASFAIALSAALALRAAGLDIPPLLVALAATTTAIGTLLPILRDSGELTRGFGMLVLAAGAMGEFGPLLVLSLLPLGEQGTLMKAVIVVGFVAVAVATALFVLRVKTPRFLDLIGRHLHKTSQLPVRLAVLLVAVLIAVAMELKLESLIGAFAAGMILGMFWRGQDAEPIHQKLDGLGFGFLIPVFFVTTGVKFELSALVASPTSLMCVPLFLGLFLLARGLPAVLYRRDLSGRDCIALGLYSATALPVVVAIVETGTASGRMSPSIGAALVGAGLLSLIIFPLIAQSLRQKAIAAEAVTSPDPHK